MVTPAGQLEPLAAQVAQRDLDAAARLDARRRAPRPARRRRSAACARDVVRPARRRRGRRRGRTRRRSRRRAGAARSSGSPRGHDRGPAGPQPGDRAPPSRPRSPRASPSARGGPGRCSSPRRRRARRSRASSAIWPGPRIAISSTSTSVPDGRLEHGERQPDLGVEFARVATTLRCWPTIAARTSFVDVLPVEPVTPMTSAPRCAPPRGREPLERGERIVGGEQHAGPRTAPPRRARRDEHAPRALRERLRGEPPAVDVLADAARRTGRPGPPRASRSPRATGRPAPVPAPTSRAPAASATCSGVHSRTAQHLPRDRRRRRTAPCGRPRTPGPARGPCRR